VPSAIVKKLYAATHKAVEDPQTNEAMTKVGAEPLTSTAAEFAALPQIVADRHLDLDFSRVVHGSQTYAFRRALLEGEELAIRARIESIRIRAGNGFVTIAMDLEDPDGVVVCTARSQMIERAAVA